MPELAIASIEAIAMPIPLAKPIASAAGFYTHVDCVTVLMHTNDGPTGFGFNLGLGGTASAAIVTYIEQDLAPLARAGRPGSRSAMGAHVGLQQAADARRSRSVGAVRCRHRLLGQLAKRPGSPATDCSCVRQPCRFRKRRVAQPTDTEMVAGPRGPPLWASPPSRSQIGAVGSRTDRLLL